MDWNENLESVTSDEAVVTSFHWTRPICNPGLPLGSKFVVVFEMIGILMESNLSSFFSIILGLYVILMRHVFKSTGLRSKGRLKMR